MGKFKDFFHYETVQIVRIRNVRVSLIHMFAQLVTLGYIIGYGLIWKRSYQATGQVTGSADIKVKGVGYTDFNQSLPWYGPNATKGFHVYDSYDLVMPAMEENALFVTTNMWVTKNQKRQICPSYDVSNACTTDTDCKPLTYVVNGRQTGMSGSCRVNYTDPQQLWPVPKGGYCDVYAWCPTELEPLDPSINNFHIRGVSDFTVFVRMNVNYPAFGITTDNTRGANKTTNGVNLWTLAKMVEESGYDWKNIEKAGMTVGMNAVWDCDFDKPKSQCAPSIEFVRLDDPSSKLSSGFNFRSIECMKDDAEGGCGTRQLTKHYGLRLLVLISGVGRKFDIVALFTAIGAGIGLLSVATLVADFIATNVLQNRNVYRQAKFKEVEVQDEEDAQAVEEFERSQGSTNSDPLREPLRGSSHMSSDTVFPEKSRQRVGSEGVLHVGTAGRHPIHSSPDDDDDVEASWGKVRYPQIKK